MIAPSFIVGSDCFAMAFPQDGGHKGPILLMDLMVPLSMLQDPFWCMCSTPSYDGVVVTHRPVFSRLC